MFFQKINQELTNEHQFYYNSSMPKSTNANDLETSTLMTPFGNETTDHNEIQLEEFNEQKPFM
jgi:hypothetical protein